MSASVAYIAASANRFGRAADISSASLVAFGSSKLIALWNLNDPNDSGIGETLPGHDGVVTSVCFVSENAFVSGDDKGILISWRKFGSQWKSTLTIQAHEKAISALCVHDDCVVTGSSDALVKIWKLISENESDQLQLQQSLTLRGMFPFAIAMVKLPHTQASILVVAGTSTDVQLWIRSEDTFVPSATLAGHEDWIRCLAFKPSSSTDQPTILASGSQDGTIRLWNIEPWKRDVIPPPGTPTDDLTDELLDAFEASLGDVTDAEEGGRQISLKRHILTVKSNLHNTVKFSVTFDALLIGHESNITSISWRPSSISSLDSTLLSTSTDSSVILWRPSADMSSTQKDSSSIWINYQRFGDIGGQRLGGFVGGLWGTSGDEIISWGWAGGWRRWQCSNAAANKAETWSETGAISGHGGPVRGIDWSPAGEYLISTGLDQTTRIHAPIPINSNAVSWHELSRPQIHGYDLLNATFIDPLRFVSTADEKVARVFEAPQSFVDLTEALNVAQFVKRDNRPSGASVPPLGLSNKAITSESSQESIPALALTRRPFEAELASLTLWPEVEKIFGHGYENITLGISTSKRMLATACRASTAEHAVVRIYDTETYRPVGSPLVGHSLTVTRIAFSPDDKYILTVSRDRSWRLFENLGEQGYHPIAADKSHGRIIWDCAWSAEGDIFATASRDKTVRIWKSENEHERKAFFIIKTEFPATAVAFAPQNAASRRRLAIGLENGDIIIYSGLSTNSAQWEHQMTVRRNLAHVDHIHRLAWRPTGNGKECSNLASCSEDGTLKILII